MDDYDLPHVVGYNENEYDNPYNMIPSPRTLKMMFQKDGKLLNAYVKDVQKMATGYIERPIEVFNRL